MQFGTFTAAIITWAGLLSIGVQAIPPGSPGDFLVRRGAFCGQDSSDSSICREVSPDEPYCSCFYIVPGTPFPNPPKTIYTCSSNPDCGLDGK